MNEYSQWLRDTPRPTTAQVSAFSVHFGEAHSWYKRLPLTGPGVPFVFAADKYAGMVLARDAAGIYVAHTLLGDGTAEPSLSLIPLGVPTTQEHLTRFGACNSYVPRDLRIFSQGSYPAATKPMPFHAYVAVAGQRRRLPQDMIDAGTVFLRGSIHSYCATSWWTRALIDESFNFAKFEQDDQYRMLVEACRDGRPEAEARFHALIENDRVAQVEQIEQALSRVMAFVEWCG